MCSIVDQIKQPMELLTRSKSVVFLPKEGIYAVDNYEEVSFTSGLTSRNSSSHTIVLRCRSIEKN